MTMLDYDILLNGEIIDTAFYRENVTVEEIKFELVNYDDMDSDIIVRKSAIQTPLLENPIFSIKEEYRND